jgi:hypothetical protein
MQVMIINESVCLSKINYFHAISNVNKISLNKIVVLNLVIFLDQGLYKLYSFLDQVVSELV